MMIAVDFIYQTPRPVPDYNVVTFDRLSVSIQSGAPKMGGEKVQDHKGLSETNINNA